MSSSEVRLWEGPFDSTGPRRGRTFYTSGPLISPLGHGEPGPTHIALPAAEFEVMAAEARSYRAMLSALKAGDNAKLPFGQVMADLGLDEPPGEALMMEVRFE